MSWKLEALLRRRLRIPHALVTSSGTHALELALMSLGIQAGDEVVVPSFTFVSTANAVVQIGATPVFSDIEPVNLSINPSSVKRLIGRKTKAIIAVHYAGLPAAMGELLSIARKFRVSLIEDAAQAIGSRWEGRCLGTIGTCGILSFHETKNVTCGEGGAFLTKQPTLARRAELIREKGTNRTIFLQGRVPKYEWCSQGSNYVLSDILAALVLPQLQRLEKIIANRRRIGLRYLEAFQSLEHQGLVRMPHPSSPEGWNWHLFFLIFPSKQERERVQQALRDRGIEAPSHFPPLHLSPYARTHFDCGRGDLPVTEQVSQAILRLPLHSSLGDAEVKYVIHCVRQTLLK